MASFDAVVVGAGPSGCVAAARLAESGRRTLVVEAGQRTPPPQLATPSIVDPAAVGDWFWPPIEQLSATADPAVSGRSDYWMGRGLGGGSLVNGGLLSLGDDVDYERWATSSGCASWGSSDMSPWLVESAARFRRAGVTAERNLVEGPGHCEVVAAFDETVKRAGHGGPSGSTLDQNRLGLLSPALAAAAGSRVSAADACLAPWLNGDRVVMLSECDVERVRTVGGRTTGVILGNGTTVACPLVVLAAGVVNTPRLLCQSDLLSSSSLPVMNHPSAMLTFAWPHPSSGRDRQKPRVQRVLRWRSSAEATNTVILIGPLGGGTSPTGALLVMLDRPRSLGVAHINVGRPTVIEGNHLSDEQDRREMLDGFRHAVGLGAVITADLGVEPPALSSGGSAQALARASDSAVEAWLRANQGPVFHAVGTCGIAPSSGGVAPITESVAGSLGRVAGTDGLLAVDASVMPGLVAGGLQLPVMAVADKIVSEYLLGKDMV